MPSKHNEQNESNLGFIITAIIVSLAIIGLWVGTYCFLKDNTEKGVIGDMFGSINALFSGLALAGIILTILLQRKELRYQRDELRETRQEFETQNETLKLQRFENTFFNILNLHHQIVSGIDYSFYKNKERSGGLGGMTKLGEEQESVTITGRDVFRMKYNAMFSQISKKPDDYIGIYLKTYAQSQTDFGHYFRNLYRMIKLVDETDFFYNSSKIAEDEIFQIKYRYTSMIRAQLSDYELLMMFYNCLTVNGVDKFKPLIEKYALLKNLPKDLLPVEAHYNFYKQTAFKQEKT